MDTHYDSDTEKDLDQLLNEHFAGRVVRKDLTKLIKEGAILKAVEDAVGCIT